MDKIFSIYRILSFRRFILSRINLANKDLSHTKSFSTNLYFNCSKSFIRICFDSPWVNHIRVLSTLTGRFSYHQTLNVNHCLVTKKLFLHHIISLHSSTKLCLGPKHVKYLANRKVSTAQTDLLKIGFWPKPNYRPMEVFRSEFLNGIRVAATKHTGAPIGACTIMFRTGSSSEFDNELGASHFLRAASTLSGCSFSGYMKSRYLQQYGGYLTCNSDRQTISFTLRCPSPNFPTLKNYLLDTAKRYYEYEIDEAVRPVVEADLARRPMEEHCMDLVQKACWGGPLNNSIYCSRDRIDDITQETLCGYTSRNFITSMCSVGSCGLQATEVAKLADHIECGITTPAPEPCDPPSFPRAGYESYHYGRGDTFIALAVPTCASSQNLSQQLLHALLAETLGTCHLQTSQYPSDRVPASPVGFISGCEPLSTFRAFSICYRERGLFGILVRTTTAHARDAAFAAAEFFGRIHCISCEQVHIGKKRLKLAMCLHDEDCVKVSEGLAMQGLHGLILDDARASMCHIDNIPLEAVVAVAAQVKSQTCRMAMACVGDLDACPDDKELIR